MLPPAIAWYWMTAAHRDWFFVIAPAFAADQCDFRRAIELLNRIAPHRPPQRRQGGARAVGYAACLCIRLSPIQLGPRRQWRVAWRHGEFSRLAFPGNLSHLQAQAMLDGLESISHSAP